MNNWNDFNDAEDQQSFELIPNGTIAKVRLFIKPGGFDNPNMGWTGGYATKSQSSDAVFLSCEYTVVEGEYAKRKVWSLIGLHSPKGPEWGNMGRSFVKSILNSAYGLDPKDLSAQAKQKRCIKNFADLDTIEFVAKIEVQRDQQNGDRNIIRTAITRGHKEYAKCMGVAQTTPSNAASPSDSQPTNNVPHWAIP